MLISLCVPTFNRGQRLRECLEALANALDRHPYTTCFEVCVSDNASTDSTSDVIQSFKDRFPRFRTQRHASNLGFAGNYLSLLSLAAGDWIAVFGDDDIASEETLKLLMHHLRDEHRTIVFWQRNPTDANSVGIEQEGSRVFDSITSLLQSMDLFELSFIGNMVFPRKMALSVANRIDTRSAYPSVALSLNLVGLSGIKQVSGKLVHDTAMERQWISWQPIYTAVDAARIVCEYVRPFSTKAIARRLSLKVARSLPRAIMLVRSGTLPNLSENPYRSVGAKNIFQIYATDFVSFGTTAFLWIVFSAVPVRLGCWITGVNCTLRSEGNTSVPPRDMCLQDTVELKQSR
jgi:hypothetical protein